MERVRQTLATGRISAFTSGVKNGAPVIDSESWAMAGMCLFFFFSPAVMGT